MAALMTKWGYSVDVEGALPSLLSLDDFDAMGGAEFSATESAKKATLAAVSAAVRDFCGWHVAPKLECTVDIPADGDAVLPFMAVDGSTYAESDARTVERYVSCGGVLMRRGMRMRTVTVSAGYDDLSVLAQVCYQLAANHLVATAGLREEHVGTAGATYNQTDNGVSGGVRLLDSDRALLAPYRITGVV
jgi:hypothetical protein